MPNPRRNRARSGSATAVAIRTERNFIRLDPTVPVRGPLFVPRRARTDRCDGDAWTSSGDLSGPARGEPRRCRPERRVPPPTPRQQRDHRAETDDAATDPDPDDERLDQHEEGGRGPVALVEGHERHVEVLLRTATDRGRRERLVRAPVVVEAWRQLPGLAALPEDRDVRADHETTRFLRGPEFVETELESTGHREPLSDTERRLTLLFERRRRRDPDRHRDHAEVRGVAAVAPRVRPDQP